MYHQLECCVVTCLCACAGPNTPGKFIVWFRNETTLLVLWQPPYPPGAYTHYKVSAECRTAACVACMPSAITLYVPRHQHNTYVTDNNVYDCVVLY